MHNYKILKGTNNLTETQRNILALINQAICMFNQRETFLIKYDLDERCICARFAMYVEYLLKTSPFSDYITDVEYNRGMDGSSFNRKNIDGHNVALDLIVHKREYDENFGYDNLFAVEMKKQGRPFDEDKNRLKVLVDHNKDFGYRAGFAIRICSNQLFDEYVLKIENAYFNKSDY